MATRPHVPGRPASTAAAIRRPAAQASRASPALAHHLGADPAALRPAAARGPAAGCTCGGGCPRCSPAGRGLQLQWRLSQPVSVAPAGAGQPLSAPVRAGFEASFGHDLGRVRLHTGGAAAAVAARHGAQASTRGADIHFAAGRYQPQTQAGRELLAHELAHAVQQTAALPGARVAASPRHEARADHAAAAAMRSRPAPALQPVAPGWQHRLEMRDVGRGEASGFARLPELIERLNAICPGLLIGLDDANFLTAEPLEGATLTGFEQQLLGFVQNAASVPLRLTNRQGLLRGPGGGFTEQVFEDAWSSAYVDIDDLLASSDLGLQSVLVHFLEERLSTRNYARRIGSASMDFTNPGVQAEFDRVHARGISAEVALLRSFFGDDTLRHVPGAEGGSIARVYVNARRDSIRTRVRSGRGAEAGTHGVFIDVRLRATGEVISAEAYRELLAQERAAAGPAP